MFFAMFCMASISLFRWRQLVLFNICVQLPIYISLIARTHWLNLVDGETPDAIATFLFLISYFSVIVADLHRQTPHDPGLKQIGP